jgi:hypothetical protein
MGETASTQGFEIGLVASKAQKMQVLLPWACPAIVHLGPMVVVSMCPQSQAMTLIVYTQAKGGVKTAARLQVSDLKHHRIE